MHTIQTITFSRSLSKSVCGLALSALVLSSPAVLAVSQQAPQVLPSGVTVQMIKEGTGANPQASDTVTVHYRGTLESGKEFDSSYSRNAPATFPLARVIPCWTEGVQKIKVGGKAKLTCPAKTAYGERGVPGAIPPNSTLNFEVELLSIAK
jgi:FKBP-type peptidyl-prolyl cis-trans isomerase FkpA